MYAVKGIIYYSSYDYKNNSLVKMHQEPYLEALQIVKNEENNNHLLN